MRHRFLFAPMLACALLTASGEASAYCRSTTCTCASAATCATDCPKDADGCPSTGTPLSWSGACAGFSLSVAGTSSLTEDQWSDAIVAGFNAWTGVDCGGGEPPSIDLIQLRNVACNQGQYNPNGPNANLVYFDDNGWTGTTIDGTLAATTVSFASSGQILDADIAFNSSDHDFTVSDTDVQTDLVSIVTHEVGHFLGVAHSPLPDAVMFAMYTPGTLKRTLTADDIAAVCAIYPPKRAAGACDPTPMGGLETSCSTGTGGCSVSPSKAAGGEGSALILLGAAVGLAATRGVRKRWRSR
jgi:Matrixin